MDPIAIILGTRPEIIKMSPIILLCKDMGIDFYIIHTNQHYSKFLDEVFFEQLRLPPPDFSLLVGSGTHGEQTGKILQRTEKIFIKDTPSFVFVHGDTNTTLAGALSAAKLNIPVGHVESGLRSNDKSMPEEINRIMTDHLSDLCFTPTDLQKEILQNEGIDNSKIFVTGNTIVDAINRNIQFINKEILRTLEIKSKGYFLTTIHRPENVEDKFRLKQILEAISDVGKIHEKKVIAPLHPRTTKKIEQFKIKIDPQIKVIDPVGYFDFLALLKHTELVITDSGGIQEETCILGTPCVTIRKNTERPETLRVGGNILGGIDKISIMKAVYQMMLRKDQKWENPFGDGKSSVRIIEKTIEFIEEKND